jgi:hypothetical protein
VETKCFRDISGNIIKMSLATIDEVRDTYNIKDRNSLMRILSDDPKYLNIRSVEGKLFKC